MLEGRLLTAGFLALMWGLDYLTLNLALFLALGVFLATGGKHTLYLAYHTLPRDLRGAFRYLRLLFLVYTYQKRNLTVPKVRLLMCLLLLQSVKLASNKAEKRSNNELDSQLFSNLQVFSKVASSHPNKPALLYESSSWSFGELEAYSNRVANYLTLHRGFRKGDCVALFMENRPEYVGIWLGCTKVGILPALINSNLQVNKKTAQQIKFISSRNKQAG